MKTFKGIVLAMTLLLNHLQNRIHNLFVNFAEQCNSPLYKVECVDIVDVLLSLIHLSLDPMSV